MASKEEVVPNPKGQNVALIILNSKYKRVKGQQIYKDLTFPKDDGEMVKKILYDYNTLENIHEDEVDIGATVDGFMKKLRGQKINQLHFHFSGHGVYNAKVKVVSEEQDEEQIPIGHCMIGTKGELFSVHDLKVKLLGLAEASEDPGQAENGVYSVETITVSLDCCSDINRGRNARKKPKKEIFVKLKHKEVISVIDQKKVAVLYGALEGFSVEDNDSFTKALFNVTEEGKSSYPISEIVREVNEHWGKKNKACWLQHIDTFAWKDYRWPSENKSKLAMIETSTPTMDQKQGDSDKLDQLLRSGAVTINKLDENNTKIDETNTKIAVNNMDTRLVKLETSRKRQSFQNSDEDENESEKKPKT